MKSKLLKTTGYFTDDFKTDLSSLSSFTRDQLIEISKWLDKPENISGDTLESRKTLQSICDKLNLSSDQVFTAQNILLYFIRKVAELNDSYEDIFDDLSESQLITTETKENLVTIFKLIGPSIKEINSIQLKRIYKSAIVKNFEGIGYVCDLRLALAKRFDYREQNIEEYEPEPYGLTPIILLGLLTHDQGTGKHESLTLQMDLEDLERVLSALQACKRDIILLQNKYENLKIKE
jgi:hypothetical protein